MELLTAKIDVKWVDTDPAKIASPDAKAEAEARKATFLGLLTDLLLTDNLIILAGLGTSLCVKDAAGNRLAPTMPELWRSAEALLPKAKFADLQRKVSYKSPADGDNIETLLSHCQLFQSLSPDIDVQDFIDKAEAMIVERCRFVPRAANLDIHQAFLRKVARRSTRKPRMKLFTVNYDLCFESAASASRFVVVDGFAHTSPQEFDGSYFSYDLVRRHEERETPDYIPNVFHLYKIHGSTDWEPHGARIEKNPTARKPAIIYPRVGKFESSYSQPFLEMISRFQTALRQPNTGFLIIGCGFADAHITQPILAAINGNVGLRVMVIDPASKGSKKPGLVQMESLIKQGDWRLTLAAATFEELVADLPDLIAQTEEEQHRARLLGAGRRP